jgi:hypothetical protein
MIKSLNCYNIHELVSSHNTSTISAIEDRMVQFKRDSIT